MDEYLKNSVWFLLYLVLTFAGSEGDAQAQTTTTNAVGCPSGQLAFSGAEGYGRCTVGGNTGRLIDVTNLNDSGPGSLRQCAEVESGPRICRVMVSGTIDLEPSRRDITITNPFVTIDGSLAQVQLKFAGLDIRADEVIVRHLRIRPGDKWWMMFNSPTNGITIRSKLNGTQIKQVIIDHVSLAWTSDDLINVIFGSEYVTIQDSLLGEGLTNPAMGSVSRGILISYGARHVSVIRNVCASVFHRWPEADGGNNAPTPNHLQFINNFNYNNRGIGAETLIYPIAGPVRANFIGNVWVYGPNSGPTANGYPSIKTTGGIEYSPLSTIYAHDNIGRYNPMPPAPPWPVVYGLAAQDDRILDQDNGGIPKSTTLVPDETGPMPTVTTMAATAVEAALLPHVGAQPRDSMDARVIAGVQARTGRWIANPNEVGGWPVLSGSGSPDTTPPASPTNLIISKLPWFAVSAVVVPSTLVPIIRMFRRKSARSKDVAR